VTDSNDIDYHYSLGLHIARFTRRSLLVFDVVCRSIVIDVVFS